MLVELKACFMEAYDDNQDGKIDIREVNLLSLNCVRLMGCPHLFGECSGNYVHLFIRIELVRNALFFFFV